MTDQFLSQEYINKIDSILNIEENAGLMKFIYKASEVDFDKLIEKLTSQIEFVDYIEDEDCSYSTCLEVYLDKSEYFYKIDATDFKHFWNSVGNCWKQINTETELILQQPRTSAHSRKGQTFETCKNDLFQWISILSTRLTEKLRDSNGVFIVSKMFLKKFRNILSNKLVNFLVYRKNLLEKFRQGTGEFTFRQMLVCLFNNDPIFIKTKYNVIQAVIFSGYKIRSIWIQGNIYYIEGNYYNFIKNDQVALLTEHQMIPQFQGSLPFNQLPVRYITNDAKINLINKNRQFSQLINNSKYFHCQGFGYTYEFWTGVTKYPINSRVVIDPAAFCKFNPNDNFSESVYENQEDYEESITSIDKLDDDKLLLLAQLIRGYSLALKKWLAFNISDFSKIEFKPEVFDKLVLEIEKKEFLNKLCNSTNEFRDLIYNKNGGQIILLYGETGTGKTLTAEALAELNQVPLYIITAGELGVSLQDMEKNLDNLLNLAQYWNAIILLDEADIFLEKRDNTADVERNAMVSVFLRKLEYFDGIMILTSNRKDVIDTAILSRITCMVQYPVLDSELRYQIWQNLIEFQIENKKRFNISSDDLTKLSEIPLNGRQIKTVIKNSLCAYNTIITYQKLLIVISLSFQIQQN